MWHDSARHELCSLEAESFRMLQGFLGARDKLVDAVSDIATRPSISDELLQSIRTLAGAPDEILREDPERLSRINVFYPSNNLIYSYVLYVLVPSLYTDTITIRPSSRVRRETARVHEILSPYAAGEVRLWECSQREFVDDSASVDLVVFTGTASNAASVRAALRPGPKVLTFASSPTPFVIGPEADVESAARALVAARLFNGGQDCLCPDAVFVHTEVREDLLTCLRTMLDRRRSLDSATSWRMVDGVVYEDALESACSFIELNRDAVVYGGKCDVDARMIEPTVLMFDWEPDFTPVEMFAPVFCLVEYEDPAQVRTWLNRPDQQRQGSYVSVFGEPQLIDRRIGSIVVVPEAAPLDVEDGNRPFGGYGVEAGAVQCGDEVLGRPLLISAEAARGGRR